MLENDILLLEDPEDDEEEYESVPGISNGHEEEDFLCAEICARPLRSKKGHISSLASHLLREADWRGAS